MVKVKITGCQYRNQKGRYEKGIHILNCKTNTFTIIDKKLQKVSNYSELVTCAYSIGNIIMDLTIK